MTGRQTQSPSDDEGAGRGHGDDLTELIRQIHETPLHPERWPQVLDRVADAIGATTVLLETRRRRPPHAVAVANAGADAHDHASFPDCPWTRTDGREAANGHLSSLPDGLPLPVETPATEAGAAADEGPRAPPAVVACVVRDEGFAALIHVARAVGARSFGRCDLARLHRLLPHLGCAVRVQRRLTRLEAERDARTDVLDRLQLGVVLIDAAGEVLSLNRSAEDLVAACDGLAVSGGRLRATAAAEASALNRLINEAMLAGAGRSSFAGGTTVVSRSSTCQPLSILIAPLRAEEAAFVVGRPVAAIFLADPDRGDDTPEQVLRATYGLTRTEAALAAALLQGHGLARAATRLGIGLNTAKTHLQRVFGKTGTHHQAELTRLILKGAAQLRFD